MLTSFIKFLSTVQNGEEYKNLLNQIAKDLDKYINVEFPPILILMNINGCLFHRTKRNETIEFIKPDSDSEEAKNPIWNKEVYNF